MSLTLRLILLFISFIVLSLAGCQNNTSSWQQEEKQHQTEEFKQYWRAGKAEINSYSLHQSRYGEKHSGDAILLFVTEDFSKDLQVKLDNPAKAVTDKVSVLKLNYIKKFTTGIYDYSMMQSVFTAVDQFDFPTTLKTTMSTQEWCGQVFTQLNLKGNYYKGKSYSYFEQEGDTD